MQSQIDRQSTGQTRVTDKQAKKLKEIIKLSQLKMIYISKIR